MTWLMAQADYLRFVYGLLLGLTALGCTVVYGRDRAGVRWAWLAAFGVLHGLHEWVELFPAQGGWETLSVGLWVASWVALAVCGAPARWGRWAALVGGGLLAGTVVGPRAVPEAVWTYTLALPVGAVAAWSTARTWARSDHHQGLGLLAVGLTGFALASGLVGPGAPWIPAAVWNEEAFAAWCGVPVWGVRGVFAGVMAAGVWVRGHALARAEGRPAASRAAAAALVVLTALGWVGTETLGRWESARADAQARQLARAWASAAAAQARAVQAEAEAVAGRPEVRAALGVGGDPGLPPNGPWTLFDSAGRRLVGPVPPRRTPPTARGAWTAEDRVCAAAPVRDAFGAELGRVVACRLLPAGGYRIGEGEGVRHPVDGLGVTVRVPPWAGSRARARGLGMALTLAAVALAAAGFSFWERRRVHRDERARFEGRLKRVLDAAPDPVVVVDPAERRVLWANRRAGMLLGCAPEGLEDAPVADLLDGKAGEQLWDLLSGREEGEVVCLEVSGGPAWLQVSRVGIGFRGRRALLVALRDVTAVAEQARQARDTARILETVLEHSDNGLVLLGPDHRIRYYNQKVRELWGVPEDVLWPGPTLEDMVRWVCNHGIYPPDEVEDLVRERMRQMEQARQGKRVEYLAPRRDGRIVEAVAVGLPDGGVLVSYRDVTARERVLAELREQEERFRGMLEALPDPVYIRGPEGGVEYANPAMVARCGRDPRGRPCYAVIHGLAGPCSWCRDPGPEPWTGEWRSPRDGRYYRVTLARVAGGDGSRRMGILRDVTVERTAGERLRAEKEFAESLVASLAVGAFVLDADGSIRVWNRAAELLTGVSASRMVGTRDAWFPFYPHPRPTLADLVLRGRGSEAGRYYGSWGPSPLSPDGLRAEGWFDEMNGRRRFLVFDAVPIRDGRGRIRAVLETLQDLTDLKEAEAGRARLDAAVEQAAEGIAVVDSEGQVRHANPAFRRIIGNGTCVSDIIGGVPGPHEAPKRFRCCLGAVPQGASPRELDLSVTPLRGGEGGAVVVARDVTQEVLLERQVRQAQKLESLGTLASGIAHDFNNILTAVTGYLELALDDVRSPTARQNLNRVLAAVDRAASLVARMLAFGREAEGDPRPVRLCRVLDEAMDLLRSGLGPEVELVCWWAAQDDRVVVDPVQVQQVVMNLVTNAAQALGDEGGRVEVSVRDAEVDEALARGRPGLVPGAYLRITVSDNGCGIPPEVLPRIFDPFFTTKEVGQGTGLGLAMVHGIVASWGGAVEVRSEPGQGTTFHVFVPRQAAERRAGTPGPEGEGERILVVDDDPAVAEIMAEVLTAKGYRPDVFGHPAEALEALEADPGGFDAVVTDQAMPGMDGMELLERVRAVRPGIPAVVCTGFEREETRRAAERLGDVQVMLKPFTAGELARTLAAALNARRQEPPAAEGGER